MAKKGQMFMINILLMFMAIVVVVSLAPAMRTILDTAQQSDSLNCNGFKYNGNENHTLSYNASLNTNTIACLAVKLYLPYIFLAVLIGAVSMVLMGKMFGDYGGGAGGGY